MVAPLALMGLSLAAKVAGGVADALGGATAAAPKSHGGGAHGRLKKTADDFETMFLEGTFDRLTETGGEDGPLGENGTGGSVYRSMLAKEHAAAIVKSGGVGISGQIYGQLLKLQEGSGGAAGG